MVSSQINLYRDQKSGFMAVLYVRPHS